MDTVEFDSEVNAGASLTVPPEVASQIPEGTPVRVVVFWNIEEHDDWHSLAIDRFADAYVPQDSVYEELMHDPPAR